MAAPPAILHPQAQRATHVRYGVLLALCAAAVIAYVQRNALAVPEEEVRHGLCLSMEQMGVAMGAFFITYALFQVPAGWLGHVLGTRRTLPLFAFAWSLAMGLSGLAGSFAALVAARLAMGAAQAGIFSCTTHTVARWFPVTGRALPNGLLGSAMSVGSALAATLAGFLLALVHWRLLFILFALPGFVWAAWFAGWFRDRPRDHPAVNVAEAALLDQAGAAGDEPPAAEHHERTPWAAILTSPAMGWICAQQFFRAAGYMFYASWFPTFLKETRGVSTAEAGLLTSLPFFGVVAGSIAGGAISDRVLARTGSRRLSRQWVSIISLVLCAALILAAYPVRDAVAAVLIISAGAFMASISSPCAYCITIDMGGRHVAPVFSLMNMSGNLGAMLFPIVLPWLVKASGSWDLVLFAFAGIYIAAALFWLGLNPAGTIVNRGDRS